MNEIEEKHKIQSAIQSFSKTGLSKASLDLFSVLGYNTERQNPFSEKTFSYFKENFLEGNPNFNEVKALVSDWKYADLLFQLSDNELSNQSNIFDSKKIVTKGNSKMAMESYLFFAIELSKDNYTRTALSLITREINKIFPMPIMVLFRYGQSITLAVINRRLNKRDEQKDVLKKVTLIKDINIQNPHRAHLEILHDLSLNELLKKHKFTDFVGLHEAWQKTLDIKELNKRFYQELANWYFWAMDHVSFPDDVEKDKSIRNATSLIRLITRIIFIWFIKEKGLVPDILFDKVELKKILKEFAQDHNSKSYYHAILQNLFFGTLNQKMDERGFAKEGHHLSQINHYGVKNLLRYVNQFAVGEKDALELFKEIPFLNGGLFDCLDKEDETGKVIYTDGFSRNPAKQAIVPDFLFFNPEQDYDLNAVYGTKNKRYRIKGLIDILSGYKFTITENTPIEEEIALDPELLGKVFENLLASYNPETQTTARKQTGSFYTPREIVNYMVDESLKAYLEKKLNDKLDIKSEDAEVGLDILFSYTEREHAFTKDETTVLIQAIDACKILDPACGSGAFPMGILHKLVHILHKLDPKNEQWKERQLQKARLIDDSAIRDRLIDDIKSAFENNELDYGRKLYLIENCIYGVDIQPIAVQIAKLRFFISLVVDQRKQPDKENYGVRSLPNLETKFVAANTLIGLDKPAVQGHLFKNKEISQLEERLKELRHNYFSAHTRRDKLNCQKKDKEYRKQIAELLTKDGWEYKTADMIVSFDPYDQNASSAFFDPEWMFGVEDGYDVVIGNPPYGHTIDNNKMYFTENYISAEGKHEIFKYFIEKGLSFLSSTGMLSYITSDTWTSLSYFKKLRRLIYTEYCIKAISKSLYNVFETATVDTNVFFIAKSKPSQKYYLIEGDLKSRKERFFEMNNDFVFNLKDENPIIKKIEKTNKVLDDFCEIWQGLIAYSSKNQKREFTSDRKETKNHRKLLYGGDISKYCIIWSGEYLKYGDWLHRPRPSYIFDNEKILVQRIRNPQLKTRLVCSSDTTGYINGTGCSNILLKDKTKKPSIKYLLALLNSKLINYWFSYYFIDVNIKPEQLRKIPIILSDYENELVTIVYKIESIKNDDSKADTSILEKQIDQMIYKIYGLSEEEIAVIEGTA